MPAIKHAVLLTMSVLGAYLYLQIPSLKHYSLQAFALVTALYLILQKRQRGKAYLILPVTASANLALLNFAFLLLTGSSGSLASSFFALTFIELFFLTLAAPTMVALLIALEIMVFHFSLSIAVSNNFILSIPELSNLLALPVVMIFYLFAKGQYEKAYRSSLLVVAEDNELIKARSDDQAVADFVSSLLNRRLPMLEFLLSFPDKNKTSIVSEVQILKRDLNNLIRQIAYKNQAKSDLLKQVEEEVKTELELSRTKKDEN